MLIMRHNVLNRVYYLVNMKAIKNLHDDNKYKALRRIVQLSKTGNIHIFFLSHSTSHTERDLTSKITLDICLFLSDPC